ncbi:TPA: hypothetical protein ACG3O0_003542 [Clostridioides difficile]|nr:hypothetical protein [Clostridioides difficile]HBF5457505.1 hypothetical protein [Clostridioides difficile]
MAKVIAPNSQYNGLSANVYFQNGTGETTNPILIEWFNEHGYKIIDDKLEEKITKPKRK